MERGASRTWASTPSGAARTTAFPGHHTPVTADLVPTWTWGYRSGCRIVVRAE